MKVKELIGELEKLPPEAEVFHLWDGEPRTRIVFVWLSKGGDVVTADYDEVAYSTDSRPLDAPSAEAEPYWHTPVEPE